MHVKIFKLEENSDPIVALPRGVHTLGRGPTLQCNDKRVSRNHCTLEVASDNVKLSAIHINPCFLRVAESKTITILSKDSSTQLNDGDSFAFLPDEFWFKIKLEDSDLNGTLTTEEPSESLKRNLEDSGEEIPDKRQKIGQGDQPENNSSLCCFGPTTSTVDVPPQEEAKADDNNKDPTKDSGGESPQNEVTSSKEIKEEPVSQSDNAVPAPSTSSKRERCWYGAECYRKNDTHRRDFSHPGDTDYESDPNDDRPVCSFGATCYRKNKNHRTQYKHPPRQRPKKTETKRARKKVDRLNAANSEEMRELSDSEEDPFLADDDSDEYVEESDEDSDWEDSQNLDEDSENVKRLVKESKRFVNK